MCSYACVFWLIGTLVLRALLRSGAVARAAGDDAGAWCAETRRVLARAAVLVALALVAVDLLRLWHQTYAFYGGFEPITRALLSRIANETLWGSGWKVQVLSAAAAGLCFAAAVRGWTAAWLAATVAAAATMASRPLTGHAVEQGSWLSLPAILQVIHVAGAALWIGTLAALALVGLRRARKLPQRRAALVAALVDGFSMLALGGALALFVAGAATSFLYLGSPAAVVTTWWGRLFVAKVIAFAGVVGLGYYNWQRVKPRIDGDVTDEAPSAAQALLLRSAAAELAVAALVLLLTAVLVALPLPTG
ncbi:MAG: CopD family protein [Acidobacteriota bacterium]